MNTDGGFGEYIRVPKEWIITPNPFELRIANIDSVAPLLRVSGK